MKTPIAEIGVRTERFWAASRNAILLLLLSWIGLVIATLQPPPRALIVAAIFPPWWDGAHAIEAAAGSGAQIIRSGAWPTILVLHLSQSDGVTRLHQAGAWFIADPVALGGCLGRAKL